MRTDPTYLWLLEIGTERFVFDHKLPKRKLEKHFRDNTSPSIFNEFYRKRLKHAKWVQVEKVQL